MGRGKTKLISDIVKRERVDRTQGLGAGGDSEKGDEFSDLGDWLTSGAISLRGEEKGDGQGVWGGRSSMLGKGAKLEGPMK